MRTRRVATLACLALAPTALVAAPATGSNADPILRDGVTAPQFSYADAIRETVWVETRDLDGDGEGERIAADIVRPRELDGKRKVPVVMDASPYYLSLGRGNESEFKSYDAEGNALKLPLAYDNYFVPRGYAYVAPDTAGTGRSTGCVDQGGVSDIESAKAVVEWLAGRGTARDADGNVVDATWSAGRTGMIGKSYDGTLANGVAASGAKGLSTIVPIGAISSWYDYNRWQGLIKSTDYPASLAGRVAANRTIPTDCSATLDRLRTEDGDGTGAYNDFWAERDYRDGPIYNGSKIKASALVVHGLQDNNVRTPNFSKWWETLGQAGVDRKLFLTRLGHVDPFDSERDTWVPTLHRWFDHELMGIDNGITEEPAVSVEVAPNRWEHSPSWPLAAARTKALNLHVDGRMALGRPAKGEATIVNDPYQSEATAVTPGEEGPHRLMFTSGTLKKESRFSGTATVDLDISHDVDRGQVGAYLVDYGTADRILSTDDGAETLSTESCVGQSTAADDACYLNVGKRIGSTPLQVIARGGARLDGPGSHSVTIELMANDVIIPKGHQVGLVLVSRVSGVQAVDTAATTYTVNLRTARLNLPVTGSMAHLTPKRTKTPDLPEGTVATPDPTALPR